MDRNFTKPMNTRYVKLNGIKDMMQTCVSDAETAVDNQAVCIVINAKPTYWIIVNTRDHNDRLCPLPQTCFWTDRVLQTQGCTRYAVLNGTKDTMPRCASDVGITVHCQTPYIVMTVWPTIMITAGMRVHND